MPNDLKIALVEDEKKILDNLSSLITSTEGMQVVFCSTKPVAAVQSVLEIQPDILITDIAMPKMTGIELIREVRKENDSILPMVFTIHEDKETVFEALKSGAYGYILKGSSFADLVSAITLLADGGSPMSPSIARKVMAFFHHSHGVVDAILSEREMDVLRLIDQAYTYNEIGEQLHISPNTVHVHIKKIYGKLHAKNRAEALKNARAEKLI